MSLFRGPTRQALGISGVRAGPGAPRYRSAAPRADLLRLLLLATAGVATVRAVALAFASLLYDRRREPGLVGLDAARALDRPLVLGLGVLLTLTALAWFAWSFRAVANGPAVSAGEGSIGPAGAVLFWFVPLLNMVVPFGVIAGLGRRLSDTDRPSRDLLVAAWWLLFLGSGAALALTLTRDGDASGGPTGRAALLDGALASAGWAIAALLAIAVVRSIQTAEDAQALRGRGMLAGAPSVQPWRTSPPTSSIRTVGPTSRSSPVTAAVSSVLRPIPTGPTRRARSENPTSTSSREATPARRRRRPGWLIPLLIVVGIVAFRVLPGLLDQLGDLFR